MSAYLALTNQLCHRLYVASNAVTRAYRPYLQKLDLTYPQYVVMMALWEQDGLEVGQVKQLTRIDGGALTQILKKLQQKNVLLIEPAAHDKRVKTVRLTPQGRQMKLQAESIPKSLMCELDGVNLVEVDALKQQLDSLIAQLESVSR